MDYATIQDMVSRFGERELMQLTDPDMLAVQPARVEQALADAQAFADGFLARVFRLPLVGCTKPAPMAGNPGAVVLVPPPQLVRVVCDVARYYLYDELAPEHEVNVRYRAAERELVAIAEGKVVLHCPWGGQPGASVSGDVPGEGEVLHGFRPRLVTDDSLRGFA